MKIRDAIKRIESDGWKLTRPRGSHRHPVKPGTVTIAGHPSLDFQMSTYTVFFEPTGTGYSAHVPDLPAASRLLRPLRKRVSSSGRQLSFILKACGSTAI
jgi:predicted RNA binding protein YcfA (HicA-like mRNA interferase family)